MKVIVKNKECCLIKKVWLNENLSVKDAANKLIELYNSINELGDDGVYCDSKEAILEMLEDEEQCETLDETVKKSVGEFVLLDVDFDATSYIVAIKHGIRYILPDNLTDGQMLDLAVELINSGDEIVETYEDLDIRTTHFRGNSTIWINDYYAENWVWSDLDLTEFDSLEELIRCYCDDITGVPACQRDELVEILIGKFDGIISCDEWI